MPPDQQRRSPTSHAAILDAAWDLAREVGHARLTVEAIAKRAGVGKQTIYRWWPTKEAILLECLDTRTRATLDFPDTGDLRADLRQQLSAVVAVLGSDEYAPYRGLIAAAQSDDGLAQRIRELIIEPRVAALITRLARAQEEGQLRADLEVQDAVELLYGPLYYRLLLGTRALRVEDTGRHLDLVLEGLAPPSRER